MSREYLEIENFTPGEATEMFNAICDKVVGKSPIEIKKSLLGIKNATKDTKISLSHLMLLIEKYNIEYCFRVTYETDKPLKKVDVKPDFMIGLKKDPIVEEMENQSNEIGDIPDFKL